MEYTLKIVTENAHDRYLLCDGKENFYTINKLLYEILAEYKVSGDSAEVCRNLNSRKTDNFFTEEFIGNSVGKALAVINKVPEQGRQKGSYIRNRFAVIREGSGYGLYKALGLLFNGYVFAALAILSTAVTVDFLYTSGLTNIRTLYDQLMASLSIKNIALCYILFLAVILIHEIGHATAAFRYGVKPKEIGAGFYFIFPVLYTNVTNIWTLKTRERSIVNLGGIYFQLLINILLVVLLRFNIYSGIVLILFISNTSSIIISFNPFFRYDGYWLFSDLFKLVNLRKASADFMIGALFNPFRWFQHISAKKIPVALAAYSIGNLLFWIWVYSVITRYLVTGIVGIFFHTAGAGNSRNGFSMPSLMKIVTLCWLLLVMVSTIVKLINYFYHGKHKRVY